MYTFTWIPVRPSRVESVRTGGPTSVSKFARFLFNFHIAYMEARTRSSSTEFESQISAASGFILISGIDFIPNVISCYLENGRENLEEYILKRNIYSK